MILIACVDDNFGMAFNRRRQSKDRIVTEKILEISKGNHLWIAPYSASLFEDADNLQIDHDFLEKAGEDDYCLVEYIDVSPYMERAGKVILFYWNRKYPSDVQFPHHLLTEKWTLTEWKTFSGFSHETITMEVYGQ